MRFLLLVVFGSLGTLARYGLEGAIQHRSSAFFPAGTLTVNLAGCFFLGGVAAFTFHHLTIPPEWRMAITVGFFGAFTTFSTFAYETVRLAEAGAWSRAALYLGLSVAGGLVAVALGMRLANLL